MLLSGQMRKMVTTMEGGVCVWSATKVQSIAVSHSLPNLLPPLSVPSESVWKTTSRLVVGQFHIYTLSYICEYDNYTYKKNQSNKLEGTIVGQRECKWKALN